MQKGDFSDAELQGVADDVQRNGKLKELADALEVVSQLESLEGDVNAPFTLLQRWRLGVEICSEAHSLLVHHLKCIGLRKTSDRYSYTIIVTSHSYVICLLYRLYYREFLALSDPSNRATRINTSAVS